MADWTKYLHGEIKSGLSSRTNLYLFSQEIYSALTASYNDTDGLLKFNLAIAINALNRAYGEDLVSQAIGRDIDEEQKRRRVLALTGWVCRRVQNEVGQSQQQQ